MELTRRDMLKMSLFGGAALLLPLERAARTQISISNRIPESQLPRPFRVPFAVPPVAKPVHRSDTTDYYQFTMKNNRVEILPGLQTEVWGYEGITPGPTIVTQRGRGVVARHINEISARNHRWTSVHLHGNASLPQYDGYASDITKPGEFKDYHFPNGQDARTLWYHDHGVHDTALNAYMGCAAFYISHDELERSLPIPKGKYDVPLVLRDATFATDGSLIFDDQGESNLYGDVILANGVPWPRMEVERRKYRFRLLNAGISRSYDLALSSDEPFTVIGTDGGLMPEPQEVGDMRFGMAERYEIVIDFAKYKVGDQITLKNLQPKNNQEFSNTDVIMRFDVVGEASDNSNNEIPSELNPESHAMALEESQAIRTRQLDFKRKNGLWTINGETWHDVIASDYKATVGNPGLNDVEIWELNNESGGWFHPVHIHLIDFKILDRSILDEFGNVIEVKQPFPYELGAKDVAYVGENERVRVLVQFGPHKGRYMVHCHNLVHEDHDMMHQFEVGEGGEDPIKTDPAKPLSQAGPLWEKKPDEPDEPDKPDKPENTAPTISDLRPRPNSKTRDRTPRIVARVRDAQTKLAKGNVKLFVDGRRVRSFNFNRATGRLSYTSRKLRPGRHSVKIIATDAKRRSTTRSWTFRVMK